MTKTKTDKVRVYTQEEMLDITLGKKGSPARDEYEAEIEAYLASCESRGISPATVVG